MLDNLLIITGLYMSIRQFKTHHHPISEKSKRRHSIIGIIFTIPLFLLVASGLPWSGFMGNQIYKIASSNESLGYPKLYMAPPESKVKELPWATRKKLLLNRIQMNRKQFLSMNYKKELK